MSDTSAPSGAPPPAAPAAPQQAPQTPPNEVVINPSPTNRPNPVGPQAPDKPERVATAREAVKAAFDRAQNPPPKPARAAKADDRPAPKAAEAREGHNNPPEETEKFDLKKRPSDLPRGERGQFAPRAREQTENGGPNEPFQIREQAKNGQQPARLPPHAPFAEPPPRISERAKQDWPAAPESVRGDYHRLHQEAEGIYRRYRGDFDTMETIRPFQQMAEQHGTTLQKALGNYVSMEQKLRADPIAGLDVIINNLNLRGPNGERLGLRDIAYHVLSQSPEQLKQLQQGNQQQAASQQIGALHQEIAGLKSHLQQMHNEQQFGQVRSTVDRFADTHPRFDELGDVIRREVELGFDIESAYQRAELLHPATHAAQTRTTPAQTRELTDRSIHGSPDVAPSNGALRRPKEPSRNPREAVQNAMARMNGA